MDSYSPKISVIVVTYNSEAFIENCISGLEEGLLSGFIELIIVDNNSDNTLYLKKFDNRNGIKLIYKDNNMGFSSGNNIGVAHADKNSDYILFLNPDVFIDNKLLENIFKKMESKEFSDVGISSPVLHGFSNSLFQPTLLVDSAGIKKTWYGRYYDFYQGKKVQDFEELNKSEFESLICGAFMFCRKKALIKRIENSSVWDESFFMYKEDIELSLYIKSLGWRSIIFAELAAFHCRGWSKSRSNMSEFSIRESIKSDWILFRKNKLFLNFKIIDFFYLILKTLFVGMEIGYRRLKKI